MLDGMPPGFPRRRHKKQAPLDTSLLCRSAQLEKINKGVNPSCASLCSSANAQGPSSSKVKDKGKAPMRVEDPLYEGHSGAWCTSSPPSLFGECASHREWFL
jgi:hypothetical protein